MIDWLSDAYTPPNDCQCDADAYRAGVDGVPVGAWVHAARQLAANNLNPLLFTAPHSGIFSLIPTCGPPPTLHLHPVTQRSLLPEQVPLSQKVPPSSPRRLLSPQFFALP